MKPLLFAQPAIESSAEVGETATSPQSSRWTDRLLTLAMSPVDIASLVYFRIGFGLIMAWWAGDYLVSGRVRALYVDSVFRFTYWGFDWVQPWPEAGMYLHFVVLMVLGLCITAGFFYRIAAPLFALGFTYVFLLERANYQNHYYLIILIAAVMALAPANRAMSVDAFERPSIRSQVIPAWWIWLLRFHVGLPYVFGGIAKFNSDWLAGEPMRQMLAAKSDWPVVGGWLTNELVVTSFAWGGLVFDLVVVPLLMWRTTRVAAFVVATAFHVTNAFLFNIHVFPWFMIFATAMFFEPDWPRRLFKFGLPAASMAKSDRTASFTFRERVIACCVGTYCALHLLWPLRLHLYAGDPSWTEQGHYFAWRMMVRGKTAIARFYVTDSVTGETYIPSLRPYLTESQSGYARDPAMVLQFAQFLAQEHQRSTQRRAEVRALVLASLNGRKPQLLIDPTVDLAKEPRGMEARTWIKPQAEPLRREPWSAPISEWEQVVNVPPLPFQNPAKRDGGLESARTTSTN